MSDESRSDLSRVTVLKTAKLFIGGSFPRSESGRSYPVQRANGEHLANVAQASRKDARDAVVAARAVQPRWANATAYNRGQVVYRIAEILEERRTQFSDLVAASSALDDLETERILDASIDRLVWYAGWADKFAQVAGGANPVAGPYFNFSVPEPTGVVAILAPTDSPLLGLVSTIAPAIVTGNAVVVVASEQEPIGAVALAEVLATSDVPGGVVNLLTGNLSEIAPVLASHRDVNAIDLAGASTELATQLERAAGEHIMRVWRDRTPVDWFEEPGLARLAAFVETKTVWHPVGL